MKGNKNSTQETYGNLAKTVIGGKIIPWSVPVVIS